VANRTNGKKDRDQTIVEYLTYEAGFTIAAIAQHKADRHRSAAEYVAIQSAEKLEALGCLAIGGVAAVGAIMAGLLPIAIAGLAITPIAGLAFLSRQKGELLAAKEQEFLRLNSHLLDYLGVMEVRGLAQTLDLADVYVQIFAERCHANNLIVTPEAFQAALANHANGRVGASANVTAFSAAMSGGVPMAVPVAVPVAAETVLPGPDLDPEIEPELEVAYQFDPETMVSRFETGSEAVGRVMSLPPESDYEAQLWDIVGRNNSFFIVGSKGAGKGILVANLLRRKLEQYPNSTALVFDPKGDSKEDGYWDHERILRQSFRGTLSSPAQWAEASEVFLNTAVHLIGQCDIREGRRLFIVFDELLACRTNLSRESFAAVVSLCSNAISMGDSEGIHAIAITQSMNSGDAFGSEEITKNMCLLAVFRQDEFSRAKKLVKFGKVNSETLSEGEFGALRAKSPVGRVMAAGGTFLPTPRLHNYSSYDRDSEQTIGAPVLPRSFTQAVATLIKEPPLPARVEVATALIEAVKAKGAGACLNQVKQLKSIGQEQAAFKVLISAIGAGSKTAFCSALGITGGTKFQVFGQVYEWAIG
jgi:hypothetical protein